MESTASPIILMRLYSDDVYKYHKGDVSNLFRRVNSGVLNSVDERDIFMSTVFYASNNNN